MKPLIALACFALLLLAADASAQCVVTPRQVIVSTPVLAVPVTPVLAATFVQTIPQYSVGYQAGYGGGYGGNDDVGRAILEELKAIKAEQQAIRAALGGGGGTFKANAPALHPGLAILRNSCAKCHDANVAAVKGGKNVFFRDGEFIDEGDNAARCIQAIKEGSMPKGGGKFDGEAKYQTLLFFTVRDAPPPDVVPMPGVKGK